MQRSAVVLIVLVLLVALAVPLRAEDDDAPPKKPAPAAEGEPKAPDTPGFPASWTGSWTGRCELIRGGRTAMTFAMELHVEPTDDGKHTWRIVYGEGAQRQVRPYVLLRVEGASDHWRIDEKNGIVLDAYFENDRLRNRFGVGDNLIEATYERAGDEMIVTLTTFSTQPLATTGGKGGVPPVTSYRLKAVQRGILRRAAK